MEIVVYGKKIPDPKTGELRMCSYCAAAKHLLDDKGLSYTYYDIDDDDIDIITLTTKTAPGAKTVPIVVIDNVWIGGHDKLVVHIREWEETVHDLRRRLKSGKSVNVRFTKSDGTVRDMTCTSNFDHIPADKHPNTTLNAQKEKDPNLFTVFDVEKQGWRSFKAEKLTKVF